MERYTPEPTVRGENKYGPTLGFETPMQSDVGNLCLSWARLEQRADERALVWARATVPGITLNDNYAISWSLSGNTHDGYTGLWGRWDDGGFEMPWSALLTSDVEFLALLREAAKEAEGDI